MEKMEIIIPLNLGINPHSYIEMELNFKKYIEIIDTFGGAVFQKQLNYYINKSYRSMADDIKKMEGFNIVEVIKLNNNNIIKNKTFAIRYLRQSTTYSPIKTTSIMLKASAYLSEFIYLIFNAEIEKTLLPLTPQEIGKKIYGQFLLDFQKRLKEHKEGNTQHIDFLRNYKDIVPGIKKEYELCIENNPKNRDFLNKLQLSRIYVYSFCEEERTIKLAIMDNSISQIWLRKNIIKIDDFLRQFNLYKFEVVVLAGNDGRTQRLLKDIEQIKQFFDRNKALKQGESARLLKELTVLNTDADRFFKHNSEFESYLKPDEENKIIKVIRELKNDTDSIE